jgi:alanine racemase
MDMVAIDLTSLHASANGAARVGDLVTLWGQGLPAERVAGFADTIPYELVCAISQRVAMRYV